MSGYEAEQHILPNLIAKPLLEKTKEGPLGEWVERIGMWVSENMPKINPSMICWQGSPTMVAHRVWEYGKQKILLREMLEKLSS